MNTKERKTHWETVFQTKDTSKVSWYQPIPETSLRLIRETGLSESAKIIDVGAGDSFLGDFLLKSGYNDITLLDISEKALDTIKNRLPEKESNITLQVSDVLNFSASEKYDLWHDRAVFHFLNTEDDILKYIDIAFKSIVKKGFLIIGTFSDSGPNECSGLPVNKYSEGKLTEIFESKFKKIECFSENHKTPSGGIQNFLFCVFQKE